MDRGKLREDHERGDLRRLEHRREPGPHTEQDGSPAATCPAPVKYTQPIRSGNHVGTYTVAPSAPRKWARPMSGRSMA
jgi:hypothetical protein